MKRTIVIAVALTAALLPWPAGPSGASELATITLASGGAAPGQPDPITDFTRDGGITWRDAVVVNAHPAYSTLPGTGWISLSPTSCCASNSLIRYRTTFELPAGYGSPSIQVRVHADNAARVIVNGTAVGEQPQAEIFPNFQNPAESFGTTNPAHFQTGTNTLDFDLRNFGDPSGLNYLATVSFTTNAAPDCSTVTATGDLWPPNHTMRPVSVAGATDADGDAVTLSVTGVTQDEPVAGTGNRHDPDAELAGAGEVLLRAERDGGGDGRVYRIAYTAVDGKGGSCDGVAVSGVPHDRDGDPAADSGDVFDSLAG